MIKILGVVLLFVAASVANELDYGIIIDSGSSGSRIFLYEWPHRERNDVPLVEPTTINQTVVSLNTRVPLASFASNPSDVGTSLDPLITYVKQNLDPRVWNVTPIYLKATAGMRALPQGDQDAIIASVRTYLATTPFLFKPEYAKVIPGTDEGLFGWISVNYALQLLVTMDPTTWGALDLGGASTQITFAPQARPTTHEVNLTIGGNSFDLYAYSYALGQDFAINSLNSAFVQNNITDASGNIINPCYLLGYNESYNASVQIVGTGDRENCLKYISEFLVPKDTNCAQCGIGSVYQPPLYGKFYAFSGFAYTYQFFGLGNQTTIDDLDAVSETFCDRTWNDAQVMYPTEAAIYLKGYCFTTTYISSLLVAYGFPTDSVQVITATKIGNFQLSYALGAMIYEASLLPLGPISTTSTTSLSTTSSPIGSEGFTLTISGLYIILAILLLLH